MPKKLPVYPILIALGIVLICVYIWLSTKPQTDMQGKGRNAPAVVSVAHPVIKPMPITLDELGTVEAEQSVNIIAQINGALKKIAFEPGQEVKQGDLLFELDASVPAANLAQAKANLQRAEAQHTALQSTANRYESLVKLEYITRQQYDDAVAAATAQAAVVASEKALVAQAEIQLAYTQIRAPISGKTSHTIVHVGDLITANSTTPLVVINRLDQVLITFSVAQKQLADVQRYQRIGTLKVLIVDQSHDRKGVLPMVDTPNQSHVSQIHGELISIDNNVNNQSGTVALKARVANTDHLFWPGELVNVQLVLTTEPKAIVIPDKAVQMSQQGNYVYIVKEGKAYKQAITLARRVKQEAVIEAGLQGNEAVIVEVPSGLAEGKAVVINP